MERWLKELSRTVEFNDDAIVLHLSGFVALAALKKEITIPYESIKHVSVEEFDASLLAFRIGTSGFGIREGRFLIGGDWCFLSYENNKNVVVLELEHHDFKKVVFQVDDWSHVVEEINNRTMK